MVSRDVARKIVNTYGKAWVERDPELVVTIFCEDGEYGEYLLKCSHKGHLAIKAHWQKKVVEEQSEIKFELLNLFVDGDTFIAEWDAVFFSNVENKTIHLEQVGIFEMIGDKVKRLREYWHSERF